MINANHRTSRVKTLILVSIAALLSAGVVMSDEAETSDQTNDARSARHQGAGFSQRSGFGFRDPARMVQRLARHLDLDETQEQSIGNVVEAARPEFEALKERARANFKAMRQLTTDDPDYSAKLSNLAMENGELVTEGTLLMGRIRAEIDAELTDEQRAQLDSQIQEGRQRGRGRGRGKGPRGERASGSDQ